MQTSSHIFIGNRAFSELKKFLLNRKNSGIFILTDENTRKYCLPAVLRNIPALRPASVIRIKSGEKNKTIEACKKVWDVLIKNKADRGSLLINLGGGMTGDLGGFAASSFMRGIDFINIPTTLLAMVDASVGGKVAVNFNDHKNQIGFFNQPKAVFIYPGFLKTLPQRELLSGFAEMIKHGLIADKKYWKQIRSVKKIDHKSGERLIAASVRIKNKIVKKDPSEKGERKKLNFGHTVGHAVETYSLKKDKTKLLHGEAIAIGMICESRLAFRRKKLSGKELKEITSFILSKYRPYKMSVPAQREILKLMQHDKKNENRRINFTLLYGIGRSVTDNYCDDKLIRESLNYYNLAHLI